MTDPKVILSLIAICISLSALIWNIINQIQQNRRWHQLNSSDIGIKEAEITIWKKVKREEAKNIAWGYTYLNSPNEVNIPYYISLIDSITNQEINIATHVFTAEEAQIELHKIGYDISNVIGFKSFKVNFTIENMGKTIAEKPSVKVEMMFPGYEWQEVLSIQSNTALSGGQTSSLYFSFHFPFDRERPEKLEFRIHIEWKNTDDKIVRKLIPMSWITKDNFWAYGEAEMNAAYTAG